MLADSNDSIIVHLPASRLFFALRPPPMLAVRIANAADWLFAAGGTALRADRLHITLALLPDMARVPDGLIDRLRGIGDALSVAPVPIVLDRLSGGAHSVALRPRHRIAELDALYRALAEAMRMAGIGERPGRVFQPHLTLGYRAARPHSQPVAPIEWRAEEMVLVHSHLGQTRHETLGRWALNGGARQLDLFRSPGPLADAGAHAVAG